MNEFITPPGHVNFSAKKLFDKSGSIQWGAIAHIAPHGGGPEGNHTHAENHIFIVTEGEATVISDGKEIAVRQDEALLVDGSLPHSIWNRTDKTITVVKISTLPNDR